MMISYCSLCASNVVQSRYKMIGRFLRSLYVGRITLYFEDVVRRGVLDMSIVCDSMLIPYGRRDECLWKEVKKFQRQERATASRKMHAKYAQDTKKG